MAEKTAIAWTDHTFNIAWGCTKVSDGCKNCYADDMSRRRGFDVWGPGKDRRTFGEKHWAEPLKWNRDAERDGRRHRVFASSMCDVFEDHPTIDRERAKLWPLIRRTSWLDWLLLTKRPERIAANLPAGWGPGWPNVWLGTSIEDMRAAARADHLRPLPAAVRFISYEPALGPLDELDLASIHWVIYGGESGPNFRPHDLAWPRAMRAKCEAAGIAFFYKQSPARWTEVGITLDGAEVRNYPAPLTDPRPTPPSRHLPRASLLWDPGQ